jgi:hypothetical protein
MNSYNIKSLSKIQQYLTSLHMKYYSTHTATRTSEPSSTYDVVIIGGGMNIHVNLQLSILVLYKLPYMPLDTVTRRKIAQCAVTWMVGVTQSVESRIYGQCGASEVATLIIKLMPCPDKKSKNLISSFPVTMEGTKTCIFQTSQGHLRCRSTITSRQNYAFKAFFLTSYILKHSNFRYYGCVTELVAYHLMCYKRNIRGKSYRWKHKFVVLHLKLQVTSYILQLYSCDFYAFFL